MRFLLALLLCWAGAASAQIEVNYPNQSSSARIRFAAGISVGPVTFANLPTHNVSNGSSIYCTNCTAGTPCTGGGTGTVARRENNAWNCGGGGGGGTFDTIGSGTNISATMTCGTGCTVTHSGSGVVAATTAVAAASSPTNCTANQAATGINSSFNATGCFQPALISGTPAAANMTFWSNATTVTGTNNLQWNDGTGTMTVGPSAGNGIVTVNATDTNRYIDFSDNSVAPAAPAAGGTTRVFSANARLGVIINGSAARNYLTDVSTDTLTNKTYDTNGPGNDFLVQGLQIAARRGNAGTVQLATGSFTASNCARFDTNGNLVDAGTTCGGGSTPRWDQVLDPNTTKAFVMANRTTTMTWNATTGAATNLWTMTDTASNTGTGSLVEINTASGSALNPITIAAGGTSNGVQMSTAGILAPIGTGVIAPRLNDITNPTGTVSFASMGANPITFTWNAATGGNALMTLVDGANDTGTSAVLAAETASGSTKIPLLVTAQGVSNGVQVDQNGVLAPIGTGKVSPRLNDVTNPTAAVSLTDAFGQQYNITSGSSLTYNLHVSTNNTGSQDKIIFDDFSGNTGTGFLHRVSTTGTSTMKPFGVTAQGTANGVQVDSTGALTSIGTGRISTAIATALQTGLTGNVSATNLIASAAAGQYRLCCYEKVTTVATTSSTLPSCRLQFTDATDSVAVTLSVSSTNAGNTTGTATTNCGLADVANATAVQYSTTGYASNSAAQMAYKIYVTLERVN